MKFFRVYSWLLNMVKILPEFQTSPPSVLKYGLQQYLNNTHRKSSQNLYWHTKLFKVIPIYKHFLGYWKVQQKAFSSGISVSFPTSYRLSALFLSRPTAVSCQLFESLILLCQSPWRHSCFLLILDPYCSLEWTLTADLYHHKLWLKPICPLSTTTKWQATDRSCL